MNPLFKTLDALRVYRSMIMVSMRGQMQYRASFIIQTFGHLAATSVEFVAIYFLFQRFSRLDSWTLPEIAVFFGLVSVSFALADALGRGFDLFGEQVRTGDFDRLLLRPRSTVLQLLGQELTLKRVGRLAQGAAVTAWGLATLHFSFTAPKIALLASIVAGNVGLFLGLVIIQATICFWTVDSIEAMNTLTYGGSFIARYPLSIYDRWLRRIFTWIVPLACTNYFPVVALVGRDDPLGSPIWFQWIAPAAGLIFLAFALQVWRFGVKRYCSTGS